MARSPTSVAIAPRVAITLSSVTLPTRLKVGCASQLLCNCATYSNCACVVSVVKDAASARTKTANKARKTKSDGLMRDVIAGMDEKALALKHGATWLYNYRGM